MVFLFPVSVFSTRVKLIATGVKLHSSNVNSNNQGNFKPLLLYMTANQDHLYDQLKMFKIEPLLDRKKLFISLLLIITQPVIT